MLTLTSSSVLPLRQRIGKRLSAGGAAAKTNLILFGLLNAMAATIRLRPRIRAYLRGRDGWMDFGIGVRTRDGSVRQSIRFEGGRARVRFGIPDDVDTVLCFKDERVVLKMLDLTPEEVMDLLLKSELSTEGNLATLSKFNFLLSVVLRDRHRAMREAKRLEQKRQREADLAAAGESCAKSDPAGHRRRERLRATRCDDVSHLEDPYLSAYSLEDFPRLKRFLDIHFERKPALCHERPVLVTEWCRKHGFEKQANGEPWVPELRQAHLFKHLLENRQPIIREGDLIAGTTTTKEIGVVLYPDTHATMIWGELFSVPERALNPYDIAPETRDILHFDVFPYWEKRNIREWVRREHAGLLGQRLDERFAVYFMWKTAAISHTIADFPKLLRLGTSGMIEEIRNEHDATAGEDRAKRSLLEAMILTLEGMTAYADNLSRQAAREAEAATDPERKRELVELSRICAKVPRFPAESVHEALNAIWIVWVGLHMENTNAGLSLGRMDQWLQPYFLSDVAKLDGADAVERYVARVIELVGCFYMRCTDHLPLVPDIGNFLFGGSSSDQAITLGGVTPAGKNAVNDMTYIFLKVTEMLGIRDPNVNARFNAGVNSEAYLERLCEVNLITTATPSLHNDSVVMAALGEFDYPPEHLRDWAATGCVEPTLSGRHMGHTGNIMFNMVAPLEMALNDGRHPLMDWKVGPSTGDGFSSFDDFFAAFKTQFGFLVDQMCEYNDRLGEAHALLRPTPLLSSLIEGSLRSGRDVTRGGATYNTTGVACIGLSDVVDSMMTVKRLVFEQRAITFAELKRALADNFESHERIRALILKKVPKFGSGDDEALAMANRVAAFAHDCLGEHRNHRNAKYTAGFWSMSNHVAFGCLSGALPSGRVAGKPFTPGLTPHPSASKTLLDPIRDVARLDPTNMTNNIAFNVKVMPSPSDSHERAVDNIRAYAKSYFDLGGMQMQFNVVTSEVLREAMLHPDLHRHLLVRISGYNAYFVTLNRQMQLELIDRADYQV